MYGKDIAKEFPSTISGLEKFKASFNAILLLMVSLAIFPIDPKFAFQHIVKANFWACDNALFALERPLSNTESEINKIKEIFSDATEKNNRVIDITHLQASLQYKKHKGFSNPSR